MTGLLANTSQTYRKKAVTRPLDGGPVGRRAGWEEMTNDLF